MEEIKFNALPQLLNEYHPLFILGNGFDLAHGIKSKFADFQNYLVSLTNHPGEPKIREAVRSVITSYGGDSELEDKYTAEILKCAGKYDHTDIENRFKGDFWRDVEGSMAKYDWIDIMKPYDSDPNDYSPIVEVNQARLTADSNFRIPLKHFINDFSSWVKSIDISQAKEIVWLKNKFHESTNAKFLTFNYTEVLETKYNINTSTNAIIHIHGSRLESTPRFIIGHNRYVTEDYIESTSDGYINSIGIDSKVEGGKIICGTMNEYVKAYEENMEVNPTVFSNCETNIIIVIGHSLSEIDYPYFKRIVKLIGNKVPWYISWHSDRDKEIIKTFEKELGLFNVFAFQM